MNAAEQIVHSEHSTFIPAPPSPAVHPVAKPDGHGSVVLVREGYRLEHLDGRTRQRRQHVFDDVATFASWLNRHATEQVRTEILIDSTTIVAGLHPSSCMGDVVTCRLAHDARFAAWFAALSGLPSSDQPGASKARRLLDHRSLLSLIRAQHLDFEIREHVAQLFSALRDFKVTKGQTHNLRTNETGSTTYAVATQNREVAGELPGQFTIRIPVFEGIRTLAPSDGAGSIQVVPPDRPEATYPVEVFLTVEEDPQRGIVFELEAPGLPAVMRQARRDAAAFLKSLLQGDLMVGLGTFRLETIAEAGPSVEQWAAMLAEFQATAARIEAAASGPGSL